MLLKSLFPVAVVCAALLGCKHKKIDPPPGPVHIDPLKVLFIGNSYTSTNDLPGSFKAMALSAGATSVTVESIAPGGTTLEDHWNSGDATVIASGGWTHVVLQGQSVEPCGWTSNFLLYAGKLAEAVKAAGAVPVFYETWPRAAGDAVYSESWSGGSPAAMQKCLHDAYAQAATDSGGVFAPGGDAWMKAVAERPDLVLYSGDGSHPTAAGTFLIAAIMMSAIAHAPATQSDWMPPSMNETDRDWLSELAVTTLAP